MKKIIIIVGAFVAFAGLGGCSNSKHTEKAFKDSSSKSFVNSESSIKKSQSSSKIVESSPSKTQTTSENTSPLSGISSELIEYARVTEAVIAHDNGNEQPTSILVTKNGTNHQVFPFNGSVVVPQDTVTLSFSYDNSMASTTIITYFSNHNGTIKFYKNPNHYQDSRYLKDPIWVKQESQKLLDSMEMLSIPTSFDDKAAQIVSKIKIDTN